uniref:Ig-like domain-containing protein n=1 Tax=Sphaeramia orbicularis TaxID=375764 RepID=A0A673CIH3_9TELE
MKKLQLSGVTSRMVETLSGSMSGKQPAHNDPRTKDNSPLVMSLTVCPTGVREERKVHNMFQQDGVVLFRYQNVTGDMTRVEYHVYELLPGSINGTTQNVYIVHGQTHTAGYLCRGGRGDPLYYTEYSEPTFVWSGDLQSSLSLKVNPDRAQHFTDDDVFLSCEGNSTEWRIMWSDDFFLHSCYMTGNTCRFSSYFDTHRLFWCESGSGEFSNGVNITISEGIILLSPIHSVNEGNSVTLGCKLTTGNTSRVAFYKNDKLIQNDSRLELNISAVSKSDEGFYKCESSGFQSQSSWVAVTSASKSSFPAWMTIWLICVAVLVLLLPLLMLCCYKKSKDICCNRSTESQGNDLVSVRPVNQDENQQQLYSSLLHGDLCVYESVAGSRNTDGTV